MQAQADSPPRPHSETAGNTCRTGACIQGFGRFFLGSVLRLRAPIPTVAFARHLGFFQQETEKLDAWADDLKLGLEQEIKVIDVEIKNAKH